VELSIVKSKTGPVMVQIDCGGKQRLIDNV